MMEDEVHQGVVPRNRPESSASASSRGRYTPQSSNGSFSANPHRLNGTGREREERTQEMGEHRDNPGQSLLQDRLREKKASRLSERRPSADAGITLDDNGVSMSSPIRNGSGGIRQGREPADRPTSNRGRVVSKKGMGIKEMEETVSTLHKQNFDLKLALFHSRQRQTSLEERVEEAEAQLAEQVEMQAVNEQLLAELEKRDQAVEEAVGIICSLEEKIDRLQRERNIVQSFDAQYENYFQDRDDVESSQDPGSSPPRINGSEDRAIKLNHSSTKAVARMPSFLSEQSEGAEALRSLYLPNDKDRESFPSLPKLLEEKDRRQSETTLEAMNSPRLSVLSESSFLSVYGDKNLTLESLDLDDRSKSPASTRHRKSLSIEKWVDDRPQTSFTPPRPLISCGSYRKGQFISLNDVLESPLQRLEKLERTLTRNNNKLTSARLQHTATTQNLAGRQGKEKGKVSDKIRRTEMKASGSQETLPPTPDTISTSTLRLFKTSNDTLGGDVVDREFHPHINRNSTLPPLSRSSVLPRPRSAGETINSRRDGHGWDTAAPSETDSRPSMDDVEIESTFDPWVAMGHEKVARRVQPPDMFNFAAVHDDDDVWGRDMMFNHDSGVHLHRINHIPRHGDDVLMNDDSVLPASSGMGRRVSTTPTSPALNNLPSPNPPARRSSLAHSPGSKPRKRPDATPVPVSTFQPTTVTHNMGTATASGAQKDNRRSRITSKFFGLGSGSNNNGKSENYSSSVPTYTPNNTNKNNGRKNSFSRSQSYNTSALDGKRARGHEKRNSANLTLNSSLAAGLEGMSATPPPISRFPRDFNSSRQQQQDRNKVRPMTSGSLDGSNAYSRREVTSIDAAGMAREYFGTDGTVDEREAFMAQKNGDGKSGGGRKWFGLGRSGSLRRSEGRL